MAVFPAPATASIMQQLAAAETYLPLAMVLPAAAKLGTAGTQPTTHAQASIRENLPGLGMNSLIHRHLLVDLRCKRFVRHS